MKAAAWAAIATLTAIVYWPALAAGFAGDDFMILHRLRAIDSVGESWQFFRGEFFGYYRPLGFVSHAIDWLTAGQDARQFHLTNLLLHLANTSLVFLIASARALAGESPRRRLVAGSVAALLFGLHASNHEAVIWISARFDLLATFFSLAALLWVVRPGLPAWVAAALFLPALLSKESAVALPIAAAAWAVFVRHATPAEAIRRTLPWLGALVLYAILRSMAGGIPAAGGGARLPKLLTFAIVLAGVMALGGSRFARVAGWLRARRGAVLAAGAAGVAAAVLAAAWLPGSIGALAREKLSVAGFAIVYLISPVVDLTTAPYFLDPATNVYWLGGAAALVAAVGIVALLWRRLIDDEAAWFACAFLVATLIPISALTEGKRYLYLPSAAMAVLIAALVRDLRPRARVATAAAIVAVAIVSMGQIWRKASDWVWAGTMVAEGARLADASLAPACGGHVVFLTSPVAVRGVYTHFLYETFELPRGCTPDVFQVLVRVVALDTVVDVRRDGPNRIVINAPEYGGNFVLSRDLRHFDLPLRAIRDPTIDTPLGAVQAEAFGSEQRITLTVDPGLVVDDIRFFYYSNGAIRRVLP